MKTSEKIYQRLVSAAGSVSGEILASELGISRTSVWKAIQQLEAQDLLIKSSRKGYRLLTGDLLLPESISKALAIPVHFHPHSQSTQLDAKQGQESHHAAPALYLAPSQSAAKGRFGRAFFAGQTGGIYMTLRLTPQQSLERLQPYTILTAAAIVKAIHNLTGIRCDIKWVNDIYLKDKKIAGILTEATTSVETGIVTDLLIGVGLNFHLPDLPNKLVAKAGNLFDNEPPITRNQLINEIWRVFFETEASELLALYRTHSLVLGRTITFTQNKQDYTAQAVDLTDKGELIVQLVDGTKKTLSSGEVSLSSW